MAREAVLGSDHHLTAWDTSWDTSASNGGDLVAAEDHHRLVISGMERAVGALHPDTPESRSCLGLLLFRQRRLVGAEAELRALSELSARVHGAGHVHTLTDRYHLAVVLSERERWADAEAELRAALTQAERALADDHPLVAAIRQGLAALPG